MCEGQMIVRPESTGKTVVDDFRRVFAYADLVDRDGGAWARRSGR
jgi:hypothetical protein